jgi:hypothetical protein
MVRYFSFVGYVAGGGGMCDEGKCIVRGLMCIVSAPSSAGRNTPHRLKLVVNPK